MSSAEADAVAKPTRRAAAQKASRLAADQLSSSSSEAGSDGPSFGEPSKRKTRVKVTYSGKKRPAMKGNATYQSVSPPSSASTAVPSRTATARRKPTRKGKSPSDGLPQSDNVAADAVSDADTDIIILDGPPTPMRKPPLQRIRSSPLQSTSQRQSISRRKRKYNDGGSASEVESLLTPLSSPLGEARGANASGSRVGLQDAVRKTAIRTPFARGPNAMSICPSIKRVSTSARTLRQMDPKYDTLDLGEEVVLVFARLDLSGAPSESEEAMWWPAQVVDRDSPLRVAPFGKYPGWSSTSASEATLTLPSRAPTFILPYRSGPTQLRFDEETFSPSGHMHTLAASPRKKRRTDESDIVARWNKARDLMLKAHQDANDGMPLLLSRYIMDVSPPTLDNYKRGMSSTGLDLSDDEPEDKAASWRPPPANFMYEIPGELVLTRERKRDTQYWPSKLMKYHPPTKPTEKPLYEILFFDGTVKKFPDDEDMFFTPSHEGFRTCKLGDAQDDYGMNEGARDEDDESGSQAAAPDEHMDEQLRASSPPPPLPAPTAFGHELAVFEQFDYVKPVLVALMNGQYRPALARHVGFMKGGRSRTAVTMEAWKRGEVSHRDKDELDVCIRRWIQRRLRRQELGLIPTDELVLAEDQPERKADVTASKGRFKAVSLAIDLDLGSDANAGDTESTCSGEQPPPPSSATIESSRADSEVTDGVDGALQDADVLMDTSTDANGVDDGAAPANGKLDDMMSTNGRQDQGAAAPLPAYAELSPLDQLTYCTSVLLPEAILQLLLWRNGHRETPELLCPEEEARMHCIAEDMANVTNWVHDIIRLKRSVDRKTLPSDAIQSVLVAGSGRLRARRK